MHYDAIIVLGRGIDQKGDIPGLSKIVVRKAVELLKKGKSDHLIVAGKWSYHSKVTFPVTEAEAMRNYALKIGVNQENVFLEKESEATITNICNIKRKFLEPKNWHNIVIVGLAPLEPRILKICHYVLGVAYKIDFLGIDLVDSDAKNLAIEEKNKMRDDTKDFLQGNISGDDITICDKAMDIINQRRQYPLI